MKISKYIILLFIAFLLSTFLSYRDVIAATIPKAGWVLQFVDSEGLVGQDGAAVNAFDGDPATFWHTKWLGNPDPPPPHEIHIDLGDVYDIDGFRYLPRQDDNENGRINEYEFYVSADGVDWGTALAVGSFANDMTEKEVLFSLVTGRYVRLVALSEVDGNPWSSMAELGVLGVLSSGNQAPDGAIDTPAGDITIAVGDSVDFSGTGSDSDGNTPLTFLWDFGDPSISDSTLEDPGLIQFNNSGVFVISFMVTDSLGLSDPTPAIRTVTVGNGSLPISKSGWSLLYVDSEETVVDNVATNAFDGDANTFWHTKWFGDPDPPPPHEIQIDLGDVYEIDGFRYLTRQDDNENGRISQYELYVSADGNDWGTAVASGTFANDMTEKEVLFSLVTGRYVRLVALSEVNGNPWSSMAELGVLGVLSSGNQAPDGAIDTPAGNITINIGDLVNFSGTGGDPDGNVPLTFLWDFGDPAIADSTDEDPGARTFNTPGVFTASFTVTDSLGLSDPSPATRTITVVSSGNQAPDGAIDLPAGDITIDVGDSVDFSGTGTDPDGNTPLAFLWDFGDPAIADAMVEDPGLIQFNNSGVYVISFTVTDSLGLSDPTPATRTVTVGNGSLPISKSGWSLLYVDSEELVGSNGAAVNAFDEDVNTIWHTKWLGNPDPPPPHEIQIDLGDVYDIDGFRYLPRQDGTENGRISQYEFYVSADGIDWGTAVASGTFANDMTEKEVLFSLVTGRYVRLVALSEVNGNPWTSMAELGVLGGLSSGNQTPDGAIDTPASDITIDVGDSVDFSGTGTDPDGNVPLTFLWDFGDSAITDSAVEDPGFIQFNNSGVYVISFTVTDSLGLSDPTPATRTVTVVSSGNQAPDGAIDTPAGNITINIGDSVNFTGTGTDPDGNTPLTFHWDFGDPEISDSTIEDPGSIQFNNTGVFKIVYTVVDSQGIADKSPAIRTIIVNDPNFPPVDQSDWSLLFVDSEETVAEDLQAIYAFDGDDNTFWHTKYLGDPDPPHPHEIQIDLGSIYEISGFRYTPSQDSINGRMGQFEFYVSLDGIDWGSAMATGTLENDPLVKEVKFTTVSAQYIRLVALNEVNNRPWTTMAELNVLGATFSGNLAPNGTIDTPSGNISINIGDSVNFSGTGTDPDNNLPLSYYWSFGEGSGVSDAYVDNPGFVQFNNPGTFTVSFIVTDDLGRSDPTPYKRVIKVLDGVNDTTIPQTNWGLLYVDSEELVGEDGAAVNAFDGDANTLWHTKWLGDPDPPHPHKIQIDLESAYDIDAFRYLSSQENGRINHYKFYVSSDNLNWGSPVSIGSFANDGSEKHVLFSPKTARFIRLVALDEVNGNPWTSMNEINIEGQCEIPYVSLVQPQDFFLQPSPDLTVTTSSCLNSAEYPGWGVKLIIDGGSQAGGYESTITSAPFEATFTGLLNSEHSVEAVIVDDIGQEMVGTSTYDKSYPVGIGGYYVAIGDSITAGVGDNIAGDNISWDYRNKEGGYTPILNNLLSQQKGYPNTVEMEGVPGYTSLDGLQRLASVLSRHPNAQYYLLMYGTNDAAALLPRPSGLGLYQGDSGFAGSYKDNIQQMINMIKNDGKDVFLAKVPFTLEPDTNIVIQEYNQVIDELVAENNIQVIPPDFYSYFEAHQDEFSDNLHPNGTGYQSMANLWFYVLQ